MDGEMSIARSMSGYLVLRVMTVSSLAGVTCGAARLAQHAVYCGLRPTLTRASLREGGQRVAAHRQPRSAS
jgi:hypothetical protein